ncbi:hypothetical protein PR202_ga04451 [Eleusine coracana subsp. coracana]|uniref:Carboxypeptidase n=1 Tax=Eleusine coracana subsp. coracana TaxID=191504 RepID=A0AAV5BPX2_ELECO|nr:hypothetical protein PR202_ga04451 [Eleusine coracana subsp. coracana]
MERRILELENCNAWAEDVPGDEDDAVKEKADLSAMLEGAHEGGAPCCRGHGAEAAVDGEERRAKGCGSWHRLWRWIERRTMDVSNLIYVDQPTGTGFSYSTDLRDLRFGEKGVADDLYDFLQAFFKEHPDLLENDFFITGESYAGHYIPAAAERVHRGNKDGSGLHINLKENPGIQYGAYADYALQMGIIGEHAHKAINKLVPACYAGAIPCVASYAVCNSIFTSILLLAGNVNYYDIRKQCEGSLCYDFSNMDKFLNDNSVRDALGVGNKKFVSCSPLVYEAMIADWMKNLEVGIPALVEEGIKVLIYAGEYDLICNWLGNFRWVNAMVWSGQQNFSEAPMLPFKINGKERGLLKSYGPLSFLKVYDSGHMVPMDQPEAALEMLKKWLEGAMTRKTANNMMFADM